MRIVRGRGSTPADTSPRAPPTGRTGRHQGVWCEHRGSIHPHRSRKTTTRLLIMISITENKKFGREKDRTLGAGQPRSGQTFPVLTHGYTRSGGVGETGNRLSRLACFCTQTTRQNRRMPCFAATRIMSSAWAVINAIPEWQSRMRTGCFPPPCEPGSVHGAGRRLRRLPDGNRPAASLGTAHRGRCTRPRRPLTNFSATERPVPAVCITRPAVSPLAA